MTGRLSIVAKIFLAALLLGVLIRIPFVQTMVESSAYAQLIPPSPNPTPGITRPTPGFATPRVYPTPYRGYAPTPFGQRTPPPVDASGKSGRTQRRPGSIGTPSNAIVGTPAKQGMTKEAPTGGEGVHVESKWELPEAIFPVDSARTTLYFSPLDIMTRQGKSFEATVVFSNPDGKDASGFVFNIAYDPKWLNFESYDASILAPNLDKMEEAFQFERRAGKLTFSCRLSRPLTKERNSLVKLRFAATDIPGKTEIRFLTPPDGAAAVYADGQNILCAGGGDLKGVLSSIVMIAPTPVDEAEEIALAESGIAPPAAETKMKGWAEAPDANPDAPVSLGLQAPEQTSVTVGQQFWVDLVLYNDRLAPIDSIAVTARFDPKILQVVDEDEGNWIARDVNIWDGVFHDVYPFDIHEIDNADNKTGTIVYRMARYGGGFAFPTGIFARVHFRAIANARGTSIAIAKSDANGNPATYVNAYGNDRLKDSLRRNAPKVEMRVVAAAESVPQLPAHSANLQHDL